MAVNADHHRTILVSTFLGPKTSPSQPLGTSKAAYATLNALNTHPICAGLKLSVWRMSGAAVEMHTRSTYVMIDNANMRRSSVNRVLFRTAAERIIAALYPCGTIGFA